MGHSLGHSRYMKSRTSRPYQTSHSWIRFGINLDRASPRLWSLLGQAVAFCEQVSGAVLPPSAAQGLFKTYLVKGAKATTAIENNTLTEEQVAQVLDGTLDLPPSRTYLAQEVRNMLDAFQSIHNQIVDGTPPRLTPDWIAGANRRVLEGLEEQLGEGVVPGEVPAFPVGVGRYLGAPREDCGHLLSRLCRWLDEDDVPGPETTPHESAGSAEPNDAPGRPTHNAFQDPRRRRMAEGILKATLAHLYIAWIHPFGDGNGRTARLVEFMLLSRAGVPSPSAHLMSNHFNLTRSRYYLELDRSSRVGGSGEDHARGDVFGFAEYALRGFVDGLAEQCRYVERLQMGLAWDHFVFDMFRREKQTRASRRRREVVLSLSHAEAPVKKRNVPTLTPKVAQMYAGKTTKTLTRDLNWLVAAGLVERTADGYRARTELMKAFKAGPV